MKRLLFVTIVVIICGNAFGQYITEDSAIAEERFTGIWARETVTGDYTEILWFKEPGKLIEIQRTGRILKDYLPSVLANSENLSNVGIITEGGSYYHYSWKVEVAGQCYIWEVKSYGSTATGPFNYRFEGNKLYFSRGSFPNRPYNKVDL